MLLVPTGGMVTNSIPEGHSHLVTVLMQTCAMLYLVRNTVLHQQPALIPNRHCLTSTRLADYAGKRPIAFYDCSRPTRGRRFLFNSSYHNNWMLQGV